MLLCMLVHSIHSVVVVVLFYSAVLQVHATFSQLHKHALEVKLCTQLSSVARFLTYLTCSLASTFGNCNSVKFHAELLNYIDIPVMDIHGRQKQQKRTTTFFQFCRQETGILLCTDVAARGLDIPAVSTDHDH
jgi:superfamily II DNA/RNA helicase